MPLGTPALFDAAKVIATFLGSPIFGFAADSFIKIERNEAAMKLYVGADGETARARSNNKSGKITLTLMQTSPSNDVLSAAALADEKTGTGIGPFMLKDLFGNTFALAPNAWVEKVAAIDYSGEIQTREWVLEADFISPLVVGGGV